MLSELSPTDYAVLRPIPMLAKGITPQIMSAFAFTLSYWTELRFAAWHAEKMGEDDSHRVFALSKGELVCILHSFAPE